MSTAVATVPTVSAPVVHSQGTPPATHAQGTSAGGSPAQQLAAFAASIGLAVPAKSSAVPAPVAAPPPKGATNIGRWSYVDEHGIRTLTLQAQELRGQLRAEFAALPDREQKSPKTRADYNTALVSLWADENGELSAEEFDRGMLSGYRLPPGKYAPEAVQHLYLACAAMLSQSQVDKAIRNLREWQ